MWNEPRPCSWVFDQKEYERFHFRQKSIYQQKYNYEK